MYISLEKHRLILHNGVIGGYLNQKLSIAWSDQLNNNYKRKDIYT